MYKKQVCYKKGGRQKEYYSESEVILRNCLLCGSDETKRVLYSKVNLVLKTES